MSHYTRDYPSRETALAIIEAMKTADGWREVEAKTGIERPQIIADRCFMVYGYPELDPVEAARWTAEATMRGTVSQIAQAPTGTASGETLNNDYGFQPRR
ncbi:hypothetical protein GOC33_06005 [Sinorhizobium meliloti]|nr:hypothetical protein [Sinorhizobium meliloti]